MRSHLLGLGPPPRAAILLGWALLGASPAPAQETTAALKHWIDGPVRYIATPDEEREFRRLEEDGKRATFVERFWSRRDPSPESWVNEYRVLFWNRVREANEKFRDSAFPGWKTDRGKIYILYGPPADVQEDPNADVTGSAPGVNRGLIRWTYEGRPGGRIDMDPIVVVPFVRDATGEYRLSYDPAFSSVFFDWTRLSDKRSPSPWDRWLARFPSSTRSPLSVMLDLGRMQEVPPPEQFLLERVETYESFAQRDLGVDLAFFEPPGTTGALVVATIALPPAPATEAEAIVVRFTARDATKQARVLAEGSFRIEPEGGRRLAQGRLTLAAGTWDAFAVVVDPAGGINRVWRGVVTIPPPATALRASPLVLASVLEPVPYASLVAYDAPFVVGSFRLTPLAGRPLRRGEEIRAFLEAYGGAPPYRATFRIEGKEDDGRWTRLGKPQNLEQAGTQIAWALPAGAAWPSGEYRVVVTVTDAGGASLQRDAILTLAPPEP